jgi:hypothetical protein
MAYWSPFFRWRLCSYHVQAHPALARKMRYRLHESMRPLRIEGSTGSICDLASYERS